MKRDLMQQLSEWKESPIRKPLILRGARQVGKSWLINEFGKGFAHFVVIDFDKDPRAKAIFASQSKLSELMTNLELYIKQKIVPGKTLLFIDEVQECPEAINLLRQFKEDLPDLHVVAAGSLLDFILDQVGMPVGRVQFMYLYPLSFGEFLTATNQDDLRNYIIASKVLPVIHEQILELLKTYLWLGGMPAVVDAWIKYKKFTVCQKLQNEIIAAYTQDFYKYAKQRNIEYVTKVFNSIPTQLGKKFKFSNVDNEVRSLHLKAALVLLNTAGVAHLCYHSAAHEQPLGATKDEKKFKAFLFDIGPAQRMSGLVLEDWQFKTLQVKTLGGIAEQFIAQELIAYTAINNEAELYYWHRESKNSNAEVDFVVIKNQQIVPVEVKAGATGHLRSMHSFLNEHKNSSYGLKISENTFSEHGNIVEIPLYGIESWLKRK